MKWRLFALVLFGCGLAAPALAEDFIQDVVHSVVTDFKRNNCWPQPFLGPDRAAVRTPFVNMIDNGWRRQNMLGDQYFEASGTALNDAGKHKVHWILTEAPEQHRIIYIHRGVDPEKTAARVAAVSQIASGILPAGEKPSIVDTSVSPGGWPAERVDAISRKFQASAPEPRLPKLQGESSSSTGSK